MIKKIKCEKCRILNDLTEFVENNDYDVTEVGIQIYCQKCGNPILVKDERFK